MNKRLIERVNDDNEKEKNLQKIRFYKENDDIDSLIKVYSKLHKKYPGDHTITLGYGKALTKKQQSRERGKRILSKLEHSYEAKNALKQLAIEEGNYELAIIHCNRCLELCNNIADFNYRIYDLGILYKKIGDYNSSKIYFEKLINTNYKERALLNLLYLEILLENYDVALDLYNICLKEKVVFDEGEIYLFLKNKLGILTEDDVPTNYYESQILEYSEFCALQYLKKTFFKRNSASEKVVEEIFKKCKIKIENISPSVRTYVDKYKIDIEGVSFADYAEVITLSSTKQIINIYPSKKEKVKILIKNDD